MTQEEALEILKLGENVYLTGTAGSGKTYLLDRYISFCKWRGQEVGITASTGIAATHLSGMTINSWAGIGIKKELTDGDIQDLLKRPYLRKRFQNTNVLIIDEVSMLQSYTLEHVDRMLRAGRQDDRPFGGIQVILCGDFFQLPPIQKQESRIMNHELGVEVLSIPSGKLQDDNAVRFIFHSPLWQEMDLKICYLEKPYRQEDARFLHMLHEIRTNSITSSTWQTLKERFFKVFSETMRPTKLYTHNNDADLTNERELAKLPGEIATYRMQRYGNEKLSGVMQNNCLAPQTLQIKKGALVMFVKNNFEEGFVNGSLGHVVDFTEKEHFPVVKTYTGKTVTATPATWEIEEEGVIRARIMQVPLRLAWGITIHKSQGMSLDAAEIDLGRSFVAGLGYVALSRVRSLEGIRLRSINRTALTVNDEVIRFDKTLRDESEKITDELRDFYRYKKTHP